MFGKQSWTLESMSNNNLDGVLRIERNEYKYAWTWGTFQKYLKNPEVQGLLLKIDKEPAAFMLWTTDDSNWYELVNLAIGREFRRLGIGSQFVLALIVAAADAACGVRLFVRHSNTSALAFYPTLGFKEIGIAPKHFAPNDEDGIEMRRPCDVTVRPWIPQAR
jgi:ribosomal protein S18 acetylase RimI-like enzyme